jgi:hypothetical protein
MEVIGTKHFTGSPRKQQNSPLRQLENLCWRDFHPQEHQLASLHYRSSAQDRNFPHAGFGTAGQHIGIHLGKRRWSVRITSESQRETAPRRGLTRFRTSAIPAKGSAIQCNIANSDLA